MPQKASRTRPIKMSSLYSLPDWGLWIITLLALIISGIIFVKERNRRNVTLVNKIPGPKSVFLIGDLLPFLKNNKEDWFLEGVKIFAKFSSHPLSRFWTASKAFIMVFQAPAIESILNSNKLIEKGEMYRLIHPWLGHGLLTSTGDKWRTRRKLITPSFHFRILEDFFKTFEEQTEILIDILKDFKDKDHFDIYPYISRCTLDVICETAMGRRIQAQRDTDSEYVKAVMRLGELFSLRSMSPWLTFDWIFNLTSLGRDQKSCLKIVHGFTIKVIKERWTQLMASKDNKQDVTTSENDVTFMGQKRRLAFLDMLLENYRDSYTLNFEDIREEVDTFMFEGHDTTASAITWLLYNIGRFPEIQQKLHEEVDVVFGKSDRIITKDDLLQLKYLELVIKESLRMFPPVPFFGRQVAEEFELSGYTIPAGVEFSFHTYIIHRNEKWFPDPEKFDPDRFLPENSMNRHPFSYIPFSAGPRNCIGQKFAMMEIKSTVSQILRNFKITSKYRLDEIKIVAELVLRPVNGMWIKLESRSAA